MRAVTIHVEEPVYKDLQKYARENHRSTSELIREAMVMYQHKINHENRHSILDAGPGVSLGGLKNPFTTRVEMLEDFFDRS